MTIEMDNSDKLKVLLVDAKSFGVTFETPDVNAGTYRFEPVVAARSRYGLGAVKGTGQGAIEAIVAAREAGRRRSPACSTSARASIARRINKRVVEALVKAGAFDALASDRAPACSPASAWRFDWADTQAAHAEQGGLFDFGAEEAAHGASTAGAGAGRRDAVEHQGAADARETALGFYLSGHLFDQSAAEVRRFCKR